MTTARDFARGVNPDHPAYCPPPPPPPPTECYLGDAVYASHDGYQIWLRTGDGNDQRIALEPQVLAALIDYAKLLGMVQS